MRHLWSNLLCSEGGAWRIDPDGLREWFRRGDSVGMNGPCLAEHGFPEPDRVTEVDLFEGHPPWPRHQRERQKVGLGRSPTAREG